MKSTIKRKRKIKLENEVFNIKLEFELNLKHEKA